jgi:hypothetical protein
MITAANRVTYRFLEQKSGEMLAEFLSVEDSEWEPKRHRVIALLQQCRDLKQAVATLRPQPYSAAPRYGEVQFYDLERSPRIRALRDALIHSLCRYPVAPTVGIPFKYPHTGTQLDLGWGVLKRTPYMKAKRGCIEESYAVELLIKLVDYGGLERLRRCCCDRWFWAHNAKRAFCSDKCRHTNYERSDEFKKQRNARLRNARGLSIQRKLFLAGKAAREWASPTTRTNRGWKEWVSAAVPQLTTNWLTLAVRRYGLEPPRKKNRTHIEGGLVR